MSEPHSSVERYGKLHETDRSFDIQYWQRLGPEAIFEAAWQMVLDFHSHQPGGEQELKIQRDVEYYGPIHR